jgi:hypothetical protein
LQQQKKRQNWQRQSQQASYRAPMQVARASMRQRTPAARTTTVQFELWRVGVHELRGQPRQHQLQ